LTAVGESGIYSPIVEPNGNRSLRRTRFFTGEYERSIDEKNRIQLPSQFRDCIDPVRDGEALYVTLGERRGTLMILTERGFEELAERIETEFIPSDASQRFELQFYALTSRVEVDKQGRFVLPDRLKKKARLGGEVVLVGQKTKIDVWDAEALKRSIGIDWEDDQWVDWQGFLRMRPEKPQ
jgi:MraZ protein